FRSKPGQEVKAAEVIGQTGETGLAAGDHLHFSILLRGVHVDPVEWWDPQWVREHVAARLNSLPAAQHVAAADQPPPPNPVAQEQAPPCRPPCERLAAPRA